MAKVVVLDPKKRMRGGCGKIVKAKIEGNKRLSLDITWVKKNFKEHYFVDNSDSSQC